MADDARTETAAPRTRVGAQPGAEVAGRRRRARDLATAGALLLLAACSRDAAVRADLGAIDGLTDQLVERVESAQDPAAGVKAGSEFLAANRSELVERMSRIHAVRGFQVNDETKTLLTRSVTRNVTRVNALKLGMLRATMGNAELRDDLDRLIDDYNAVLKGG